MSDTVFTQVGYTLGGLVNYIKMGEIGLPDIQRPFVWPNSKVRDLFDSMYRGYPVGYLLFWKNGFLDDSKTIGTDDKQKIPNLLIVDGQQRMTSLYAVIRRIEVVRKNYDKEFIKIAFNPIDEKFEVHDAAIAKNKSFIPDISVLWDEETDLFEISESYISGLEETREIEPEEKKKIRRAISSVEGLKNFPFTALELSPDINEEQVAEVFVRINSQGESLKQSDFILTLMSVFWDEGRKDLEEFCGKARKPSSSGEPSPYNHYIHPDPDQMLRACVGFGFKRARLKYVYSILRGKDLETEKFSEALREKQFGVLKEAQGKTLDIQYWHDFLKSLRLAGYMSKKMLTSDNNLIFSYILYLMGRLEYGVDSFVLRKTIAKWFFMSNINRRYTGSPESAMEFDLARFREITDKDEFVSILNSISDSILTGDYWSISLPTELATSSPRSPSLFSYHAALILLDAKALWSNMKFTDILDPNIVSNKSAVEKHHLFPFNYLKNLGYKSTRDTNQIANYALLEWGDNVKISDQAPKDYINEMEERFSPSELEKMYYWHALPKEWYLMDYPEFLIQRRELISKVIRDGYEHLSKEIEYDPISSDEHSADDIISQGESENIEFKSTLRINLHTQDKDSRIENTVMKTIAGFLNTRGGELFIGIDDSGQAIGIENDKFKSLDNMSLHLVNLINDRIGKVYMFFITISFPEHDGVTVMSVKCRPSPKEIFLKEKGAEKFYVRTGPSTVELTGHEMQQFISQRFR